MKITPAHDIFDYELATKHNLPIVNVIDESGKVTCSYEEFNVSNNLKNLTIVFEKKNLSIPLLT